ncbi:MAG: C4-type zinc ribbon domain-containing protein [Candidatus Omnitrophica bacterium]|jgi:hypothetical protein|nr:C4-type zinc ribbon domain-containing protein [Candidatus Omnitrophota bacterium]
MPADLKAQIAVLLRLQDIDRQIYLLNNEKQNQPLKLKAIDEAFDLKKQVLAQLEKAYLDLQKAKKDFELELGSREEAVKKLQGQLYSLKTNKEYNTMLGQIQDAKADMSLIEDKILSSMDQIDKAKQDMDKEKQMLAQEEKAVNEEKKKITDSIKLIDEKISQLEAQRSQVIPEVDKKIFAEYERILSNRNGLGIVAVKNNSCQGCNLFMPAQVINLIKMYDHIITCENCNRMLYIEE